MTKLIGAIKHPKAIQEFTQYTMAIREVMMDKAIDRKVKRQTLNDMVNNLSDKTFELKIIAEQILEIADVGQNSPDICKQYKNTESQVAGVLEWMPRMVYHKDLLYNTVKNNRKKWGVGI